MIKLLRKGTYRLGETKRNTKILYLDDTCYIWVVVPSIGDVISQSQKDHELYEELSAGRFRMYQVKDEPDLVDLRHLELEIGTDSWQGYLLLTGLPTTRNKRSRIIPTKEIISVSADGTSTPRNHETLPAA